MLAVVVELFPKLVFVLVLLVLLEIVLFCRRGLIPGDFSDMEFHFLGYKNNLQIINLESQINSTPQKITNLGGCLHPLGSIRKLS